MLTSLHLRQFKSFRDVTLPLGPFTLIVGTNASGKSNLRDALRFLHGIGQGYSLAEIIDEKFGEGGERQWAGIRGGTREIAFEGSKSSPWALASATSRGFSANQGSSHRPSMEAESPRPPWPGADLHRQQARAHPGRAQSSGAPAHRRACAPCPAFHALPRPLPGRDAHPLAPWSAHPR
ncbi:AAA family ATPase [Chondromyces apiculatus]|nr:AAA family ATPase [Chondromyces apiculatus]